MKNLQIFWQLIRLNIKKSLIYRANFLITLVAMILWIGIYVLFFEVLFLHVDEVAGWNKGEMMVFLAFYYLVQAIGNIFYRESFELFGEKMRRGQLDHFLTKPASKQLLLFFENIRFDHVIDFVMALVLFGYIGFTTDVVFTPTLIGISFLFAFFGNILFYGLLLCVASIIFFVDRMESLGSFMWNLTQVSRYPRQIYKGVGQVLFQFVFPITLMTSIPAEVFLDASQIGFIIYFIGITIVFFLIGNGLFRLGIRNYSSAN